LPSVEGGLLALDVRNLLMRNLFALVCCWRGRVAKEFEILLCAMSWRVLRRHVGRPEADPC
jgi:hypothetical protein